MPIQRFGSWLQSSGRLGASIDLLKGAHRAENLDGVMCRDQISIDWRGHVYDCEFNQMLGMALDGEAGGPLQIRDLSGSGALSGAAIHTGEHCYGCSAGQGSACGGALS